MRIFGIVFTFFPLLFLTIGGYMAVSQQSRIQSFVPTPAKVLSKRIESRTSSEGNVSYRPLVEFEYEVEGQRYTANRVLPTNISSSHGWASKIVARFRVGQEVEAYRDPEDPTDAYLLKEASFLAYIFLLFPMIFMTIGVGVLRTVKRKGLVKPTGVAEGGYRLQAEKDIASRCADAWIFCGMWWGMGALVLVHYLGTTGGELDAMAGWSLGIYGLLGLGLLGYLLFNLMLRGKVEDAVVVLDQAEYSPGETLRVDFRQQVKGRLSINNVAVTLLGEETIRYNSGDGNTITTQKVHEEPQDFHQGEEADMLDSLACQASFTLPEDTEPSRLAKGYPQMRWYIHIHTDIASGPDYKAKFQFRVRR